VAIDEQSPDIAQGWMRARENLKNKEPETGINVRLPLTNSGVDALADNHGHKMAAAGSSRKNNKLPYLRLTAKPK